MEFVQGLMLLTLLHADRKRRQSQLVKQLTTWEAELPPVSKDWHAIKNELQKNSEPMWYHKERDAEKSWKEERRDGKINQINMFSYLTKLGSTVD